MPAAPPVDHPARVAFALERFEAGDDGLLHVEGTWSGVRGMRFVRPALVVRDGGEERTLLAVLEHKPWAPDGRPWRAAFPWAGGEIDPQRVDLAVAPSVVVPLAGVAEPARADPQDLLRARLSEAQERIRHLEAEVAFLRRERTEQAEGAGEAQAGVLRERDAARAERDAALEARAAAIRERDAARRDAEDRRQRAASADEERRRAEREADEARHGRETMEADQRSVQREREQAERERARAARELEAAREAQQAAEAEREDALARPAGAVPFAAVAQQRRAEHHERESAHADWAARVAALVALLVLLILFVTFLKVL